MRFGTKTEMIASSLIYLLRGSDPQTQKIETITLPRERHNFRPAIRQDNKTTNYTDLT